MEFIDREAVKGELPDEIYEAIEWDRFDVFTREAILGQDHSKRTPILKSNTEDGERGVTDFKVKPFDAEGWTEILYEGLPLLRLHVSRLLKGGPLNLGDMKPAADDV